MVAGVGTSADDGCTLQRGGTVALHRGGWWPGLAVRRKTAWICISDNGIRNMTNDLATPYDYRLPGRHVAVWG